MNILNKIKKWFTFKKTPEKTLLGSTANWCSNFEEIKKCDKLMTDDIKGDQMR